MQIHVIYNQRIIHPSVHVVQVKVFQPFVSCKPPVGQQFRLARELIFLAFQIPIGLIH
jgi:hypothetical protein